MLNGISPLFIFQFKKLLPTIGINTPDIPLLADVVNSIPLVAIPLYLDEEKTGVYLEDESKHIDVGTKVQGSTEGGNPKVEQYPINSSITINLKANKGSLGLKIFSTIFDVIFPKVVSSEYSISYLHENIVGFGLLIDSFSITPDPTSDLLRITVVLSTAPSESTKNPPENRAIANVGQSANGNTPPSAN